VNAEGDSFRREPGTLGRVAVAAERKPSISDFILLRLIGRGSYGDVWLARGLTGIYRAIKVIYRDRFADKAPFEREFNGLKMFTAMSLPEAGHLALLHVGQNEADGYFYYVMELADDVDKGRQVDPETYQPFSLRELLGRKKRLPAVDCVPMAVNLTRALSGLHLRGLVHRDIKPSNIIIVGGQPKLADIGLVTSATDARTFVGTEGYVPPEGPGKPSADVFALGKVIYELSTGLTRGDFPRLPEELRELPDRKGIIEINEIVLRACDPTERERYPDAAAMLVDLLALQSGHSLRLRRSRARFARFSGAVAVALGVAAGLVWWKLHPVENAVVTPSEASVLVAKAWQQMNKIDLVRGDLDAADAYCKRACGLDPLDPDAWAAWSQVNSLYCSRNIDTSLARREAARSDAARALALDPRSAEGRLAQVCYLTRVEQPSFLPEANRMLLQLLAENPTEWRALVQYAALQERLNHPNQARVALMRATRNPESAARAWLMLSDLVENFDNDDNAALDALDRSIAAQPLPANLCRKLDLLTTLYRDLDAGDRLVKGLPESFAQSDQMIPQIFRLYYFRREPERALDYLNAYPRDWFISGDDGPMAYFKGQAHEMAGRKDVARIEWRKGLKLVDERLAADPTSRHLLSVKARLLIYLGEYAEAEKILQLDSEAGEFTDWTCTFILRVAEERLEEAMDIAQQRLKGLIQSAAKLRLDPQFDPLRNNARFKAELARAEADPDRAPKSHWATAQVLTTGK